MSPEKDLIQRRLVTLVTLLRAESRHMITVNKTSQTPKGGLTALEMREWASQVEQVMEGKPLPDELDPLLR